MKIKTNIKDTKIAYKALQDYLIYRKSEKDDWNFLTHMDPSFFEDKTKEEIIEEIDEYLN